MGARKGITIDIFREKVGRDPIDDELDRCNCDKVGKVGHYFCGWCPTCDKPRSVCNHMARR